MKTLLYAAIAIAAAVIQVTSAGAIASAEVTEWTRAAEAVQGPLMLCEDFDRLGLPMREECDQ